MSKNIEVNSLSYKQAHLGENTYLLSEGRLENIESKLNQVDKFDLVNRSIKWNEILAGVFFSSFLSFLITCAIDNKYSALNICICLFLLVLSIYSFIQAFSSRKRMQNEINLQTKEIRDILQKCKNSLISSND